MATEKSTKVRAATDIATGINALGSLSMLGSFIVKYSKKDSRFIEYFVPNPPHYSPPETAHIRQLSLCAVQRRRFRASSEGWLV
jgi:hypothetical protein